MQNCSAQTHRSSVREIRHNRGPIVGKAHSLVWKSCIRRYADSEFPEGAEAIWHEALTTSLVNSWNGRFKKVNGECLEPECDRCSQPGGSTTKDTDVRFR